MRHYAKVGFDHGWSQAGGVTLWAAGGDPKNFQRAFLPVFRISKRLAQKSIEVLKGGLTGHHEAFLPTVCLQMPWCKW